MTITLPFIHLLSIFALISSTGLAQDIYQDEINSISPVLHQYLVTLGRNASEPQPKFGLEGAIDPLMAIAPLRYVHDGDLLKLRLILTNVTLEGISSMTVQEVTFNVVGITSPSTRISPSSPPKAGQETSNGGLDPSTYDFLPELKSREPVSSGKEVEYDYYDDNDVDDYEVMTSSVYDDAGSDMDNGEEDSDDESGLEMDDDEDYSYQGDEPVRSHRHKNGERSQMSKIHNRRHEPIIHSKNHVNYHKSNKHDKRSTPNGHKVQNHENKFSEIFNADRHFSSGDDAENLKSFEEQFLKDYDEIIGKSKFKRHKRSLLHHNKKAASVHSRHPKKLQLKWSLKPDGDSADDEFATYQQDDFSVYPDSYPLKYDASVTSEDLRTSGPQALSSKTVDKEDQSSQATMKHDKSNAITRFITLGSNVRVAFRNLKIKAQYVVKGKAGGVFTFKEQGKLVLTIPNAFLTSKFNLTLIPDFNGFRHWRSNRRNHVRVQKVRSRLSLETPTLELIPVSRPTEWVRRQLQEKMDELGKGVGRRDGAVRLLLRHWARLLRRLVTKAAKQP